MARWELTDNHYILGGYPGEGSTQWQFEETNRDTGRTARKLFEVPCYLEKGINVCQNERSPRDFVFVGPPTPEMLPLDDDAEKISAIHRAKWVSPMDLPAQGPGGFNDQLLEGLSRKLEALLVNQPLAPAVPQGSVSREEFELLQRQLLEMQAQLLKAKQVEEEEEPLSEVEPTLAEMAKSEAAVERRV